MMSFWRNLQRGLRVLVNRRAADQDVADEVEHYLEESTEAFMARGLSLEEARRAARVEMGSATLAREQVRSFGWENLIATFLTDLRYAARWLRNNPGFAAASIITLALGLGASTAIFSAVNPILFEPLPYPRANRVMMMWEMRRDGLPRYVSYGLFHGLVEESRSFEAMAAMKPWQPAMVGSGQPERLQGQQVSTGYFRTLGAVPAQGRDFQTADDQFHGPNVVILSDGLWRRRFAADNEIVGRQVTLDDKLYTVVGVMPASFENVLAPAAELWAPLQYDPSLQPGSREWGHHLRMIGRLLPGLTPSQARNQLNVILHPLAQTYAMGFASTGGAPEGMIVTLLQDDLTRGVKPALLAILGAVLLLLLIACVNVTNLLLARGAQRRGEFGIRTALGAARPRLIRQLLTESLLLSTLGGIVGMAVAALGIKTLVALAPPGLPRAGAIRLDGAVFAFAICTTTLIGLAVGITPALQASRAGLHDALQEASKRSAGARQITRRALVVAQVSLALVLLVSAGLLVRSLSRLFAIDPGFDPAHVLTMQVQEYGHRYHSDTARALFFAQALESVGRVPGVASASFTSQLPLSGDYESYGIEFETLPGQNEPGFRYSVSPAYFETMRIPLRRGRLLDAGDRIGAPVAVLISESLAKRKFQKQDPIGQRLRLGPDAGQIDKPWATIVGVVDDVKQTSLTVTEPDAFYTSNEQWLWVDDVQSLVVRTHGDAASLIPAIRDAIWSVDKDQPIVRIATMDSLLAASEAERRFALTLFATFGIAALILVASGIYGVLSGSVTERIREIGVRLALGASPRGILRLILHQGMALTGIGVAIGLAGAVVASQAMVTLLYGISRLDLVTYAGVVALLAAVSGLACWAPAWRAARVDPSITLRAE
jgi:putative ABC transport system permease protein